MRWPAPVSGAAALGVILALAPPAAAGTVSTRYVPPAGEGGANYGSDLLIYAAAPGERNDVSITSIGLPDRDNSTATLRVEDTAAEVKISPGAQLACRRESTNSVVCLRGPGELEVSLSDGDDRASVPALSAAVHGGAGKDVITTGSGWDRVDGGLGRDLVRTGAGSDVLLDAGGSGDLLDAGSALGPNSYSGRGDTLDLSSRRRDIRVDLRTGGLRSPGERDRVRSIENVVAGRGDDVVIGDGGSNTIEEELFDWDQGGIGVPLRATGDDVFVGGGGRDRIASLGGSDRLIGNAGNDSLRCSWEGRQRCRAAAGAGNDLVNGSLGPDRLDGGPGRDRLFASGGDDTLLARDGQRDVVDGQWGRDRARVDRGLDRLTELERLTGP